MQTVANTGWIRTDPETVVFKKMYFPTTNNNDYQIYSKMHQLSMDEEIYFVNDIHVKREHTKHPSASRFKDSDRSSM